MKDEWSGLAALLAELIAKYAGQIDIDSLPDNSLPEQETDRKNIICIKSEKPIDKNTAA